MREIERAKRVDNDEWVYGYYLYVEEQNKHYILTGKLKNYSVDYVHTALTVQGFEWFEVKEETVGQCVGLKDKNIVKIYDGDIVQLHKLDTPKEVRWDDKQSRWCLIQNGYPVAGCNEETLKSYEIIGNIYDNPSLLKIEIKGRKLTPYFTTPDIEFVEKVTKEVFLKDRQ